MFSKLALRNVRRSFRDYGVYLLTLTFGVCLFYTFNSIDGQGVMVYLAQSQNPMAQLIQTILDIFSVFVAVVLACLILYANTFLIRRRKRELGTYLLLGLSQRQVSGLLVLETLVIGLISLAAGLLLGLAASQGLSALTLSMFSIRVDAFALAFSPRAAVRTVGYFGLIFLLVMVFSGIQVSRARLIDLMQGERKNEELRERPLGLAVVQFVLGAVCLAAAYAILLTFGMAIAVAVLPICAAMLFLGTLGTLLIFKSLSGFVVKMVQSRPGLYFRGLNLFTLRQWLSRVHSTYLSMTVICILLLLAVGITASSIGLNSTLEAAADEEAPFDLTVQNQSADSAGLVDFPAVLAEGGFDLDRLGEQLDVLFYYNDPAVTGVEEVSAAIRLSDYNALLAHGGRGSCHEEVSGLHLPAGGGRGAGPPAAEPGGGQPEAVRHAPPAGGGRRPHRPLGLPAGGSGLPDAPGAGPDPLHGGDEGGQRHHCHGGRGGLGGEQPGHSRCADPGLRRLLPGHSPGLPSDGPAELDQA